MQDHTPMETQTENRVKRGIPGPAEPRLGGWDHRPGDRNPQWYQGRGTSEAAVLNKVNQPSSYERLSESEKAALQEWIGRELVPSNTMGEHCSYGLKHIYERLGGSYVNNGEFKGAMLVAGYEPLDRKELNWQFLYKTRDPALYDKSVGRVGRGVA